MTDARTGPVAWPAWAAEPAAAQAASALTAAGRPTAEQVPGDDPGASMTPRPGGAGRPAGDHEPTPPVIDLRGLSRSFPGTPPVEALRRVDLTVQRVGPQGAVLREGLRRQP